MATAKDPGLFIFQETIDKTPTSNTLNPSKPIDNRTSGIVAEVPQTPVNMYEYSLGIKDIQAKHITYGERQAYVSKPLEIPGNVMEIELEATEEHPIFDAVSGKATPRRTSIEYSISYKDKPSIADWVPLLPTGQKTVSGERLFFVNKDAELRFPAKIETIVVYANGLKLNDKDVTLLSNQGLTIAGYSTGIVYTVDYTPDSYKKDPWVFKLNDYKSEAQTIVETFKNGTAFNKTITLGHYPFVDMQKVLAEDNYNPNTSTYKPMKVRLTNASIQGKSRNVLKLVEPYREDLLDDAYTYNKSLYKDKSWSELKNYSIDEANYYGGFDYYQWKNKLTFTENFNVKQLQENLDYTHGNSEIEVTYQTLISNFRLKIVLRRNTAEELTASPKVSDYRLRFKTIK